MKLHSGDVGCMQAFSKDNIIKDRHLLVSRQTLDLGACYMIANVLSTVRCVRVLTLSDCGLRDNEAVELAIGVKQGYQDLWALDLRHNSIGDRGAAAMADIRSRGAA
ncbi:hypothetical protein HaLaN_02159 [Haematococcus lacustris]|uniref:Uncharacterized protein n=1 Tax=Haematococcus lacustris TaxID=44745 RepID=A0A699YD89_HAELA|nr:hypothetical protein HaLaN_02159 [Haematococcus lacustris]